MKQMKKTVMKTNEVKVDFLVKFEKSLATFIKKINDRKCKFIKLEMKMENIQLIPQKYK